MSPFSRFALYFAQVARSGSLRKAAEKLHVSAPAINRQILQAEEAFGTALFERLPEGLRMTTAGELLYDNILRWQREFRITRQRFDDIQGLKRGHVSVGLVQALSEGIVAEAFAHIAADNDWLRLELSVGDSQVISERVRQSEIDFGLVLDPDGQNGLDVIAFAELVIGVAMPPDNALRKKEYISLGELSNERHIFPGEPLVVNGRAKMLYRQHNFSPENAIICNDIRLIKSLIKAGNGVSVLSLLDVLEEVKSGQLSFVPLQGKYIRPLTLALCTAPARQLSKAAQMTINEITAVIESLENLD
ncbi:LysR family transcriptional regulator [Affinibrenneria salicis]|uniref:LysR family transcriptional regulator n=1 Tax=Affinibrenneria salicis TaxID=2590031 RepID=A0A5J5G160_9GAMM|nr:LysR family transcriptional regulator [Affinibrenneria salicis]KAA9000454.1 LysR family transcriptional regulator [Affinibrenneria salicis]